MSAGGHAGPWRPILGIFRWLAAIAVLAALLHFLPLEPLRAALARVPLSRFFLIVVLYIGAHAVGMAKWRLTVNAAGAQLPWAVCVQCYAGGLFGTLFLPSIIGGDVVRMTVGIRRSPRPAAVVAGNVADRTLDVLAQATLVAVGLALLPGSLPLAWRGKARSIVLVSAGATILLLLLAWLMKRMFLAGRSVRFRRRLGQWRQALRSVRSRPRILFAGWTLGVLVQFAFLLLTVKLAVYCGLILPLRDWLFAWPLAKLAALLPLTQGGIGIREAALVGLLRPFGASASLVLATGLIWEAVTISGGLLFGALALSLAHRNRQPAAVPVAEAQPSENTPVCNFTRGERD
jgi:uncharacterized protein (TIRG00374 family)